MPATQPLGAGDFDTAIDRATDLMATEPGRALPQVQSALAGLPADASAQQRALGQWALGLALSYSGEHAQGIARLQQALDLVPADAPLLRGRVLRGLSIAHEHLGAVDATLDWALQALAVAREQHDPALLRSCLLSAGVARSRAGDADAGLQHYLEVLPLAEAAGQRSVVISVLNNIGINCKNLGRHEEAVAHLRRARAMAQEDGLEGLAAVAASNLGEPLWKLGRLDEARQVLQEALRTLASSGHRSGEIHARVMLGQVLLACGEPEAALPELARGLEMAQHTGSLNHVARAHLALSALHKLAGRFEAALAQHEAYHAAERKQFNEESARKLHALQVQHDLAEARLEAQTQRLRHTELKQAHDELTALHRALLEADREKTRLLVQLEDLSRSDGLTGLANRRHLDERLREEFERARRQASALAVAMCDLDNFKRINDQLGHATGDAVLRGVAALLRRHFRSIDIAARYGGEEFCIVFVEADGAAAERACEGLRQAVELHDWAAVHPQLVVTLSIGVADDLSLPSHESLIAAADSQLYEAKRRGKNQVCRGLARPV
jgi:diguanylate cyclase (GGDEF)-like protein